MRMFKERIPEPASELLDKLYLEMPRDGDLDEAANIAEAFGANVPGNTFLEIGCSDGRFSSEFARTYKQGQVIGIDTNPEAIARASHQNRGLPHLKFVQMSVYDLIAQQERLGKVYGIYCRQTLHHLNGLSEALRQMHEILLPGGTLILQDFDRELAGKEGYRCGLSPQQQQGLYQAIKQGKVEREIKRLGYQEQLQALTFFSILAAYDSTTIKRELEKKGLDCHVKKHPEQVSFKLIGIKPGNSSL